MKKTFLNLIFLIALAIPTLTFAKGIPLPIQLGDEIFKIKGRPTLESGHPIVYLCQRFGLLGADVWTWDCHLRYVAANVESENDSNALAAELATKEYPLSDRERGLWNHYGILLLLFLLFLGIMVSRRER